MEVTNFLSKFYFYDFVSYVPEFVCVLIQAHMCIHTCVSICVYVIPKGTRREYQMLRS